MIHRSIHAAPVLAGALAIALLGVAVPAHATLLSAAGSGVIDGTPAGLDMNNGGSANAGSFTGFDELQDYVLSAAEAAALNATVNEGTPFSAGMRVDSHFFYHNNPTGTSTVDFVSGSFAFDGIILGVFSASDDPEGVDDASGGSAFLRLAAGVTYAGASFTAQGFEGGVLNGSVNGSGDGYAGLSTQTLGFESTVTQPGDWIRVVTTAHAPEPETIALLLVGALATFGARQRRARA